jgi:ABC-2 type transport system ATP-binding protein
MPDAIVINHLTKTFGTKLAVSDLSLNIPAGSLCGVIGPNGAGKTTTIRMIMSIIFPDSGELSVLGHPSAIDSKDRIGYLPEERGVYRKMKVGAFLNYMARLKGVDSHTARRRVTDWLGRVGLGDVARKRCEELSKGMQQKVQFIAAIIHEPDLLILDEVFSGLDPVNRQLMRELIDEQHRAGRTILFSTHAMYEAEQLCDRIFMIHQGRKVLDASMAEIRSQFDPRTIIADPFGDPGAVLDRLRAIPGVHSVVSDEDADDAHEAPVVVHLTEGTDAAAALAAVAAAAPMRRVELKRVTLEDVFFQLVGATPDAVAAPAAGNGQAAAAAQVRKGRESQHA